MWRNVGKEMYAHMHFKASSSYNYSNVCFCSAPKTELKPKLTTLLFIREVKMSSPQASPTLCETAMNCFPLDLIYLCLKEDLKIKKPRNGTVGENTWTLCTGRNVD